MSRYLFFTLLFLTFATASTAQCDEISLAERKFFENEVRPLLANHCFKCHGKEKPKGELRLDSIGAILAGGESGPALVEGKPAESLLLEAVRWESFEMPPSGKLPNDKIAVLEKWVKLGAPWPGGDRTVRSKTHAEKITAEDRAWWSFQPVKASVPPKVANEHWSHGIIDPFIFRKQQEVGVTPAKPASKSTLIRRLSFDIRGVPPTPEEVAAFVANDSPNAYEELVDSFLESPFYGERQATLWLDLVRYADSDGYKQDAFRPHAWRYRDYVVNAFNTDKTYRRFVQEQLAGDELVAAAVEAGEPINELECMTATGYLRNGIYEYNQRDVRTQWDYMLIDVVDTTSDVFLAMGAGCARCHDHKFDPILQKDYYRLKAFFAPMVHVEELVSNLSAEQSAQRIKELKQWEEATAEIRKQLKAIESPHYAKVERAAAVKFPPDIRDMLLKEADQRTPFEIQMVQMAQRQIVGDRAKVKFPDKLKGDEKESWVELQRRLKSLGDKPEKVGPTIRMATDVGAQSPVTVIPGGKNAVSVEPGFFTILSPEPATIANVSPTTTGRRTTLANWITADDNPLTARVIVNRLWQQHFGRGLVSTASDFGHLGEPPSHPELLDALAADLIAGGWKLKRMHKQMVMSAAYRQSSHHEEASSYESVDPENKYLWRAPVRRLSAEQIRDAMLVTSGQLDASRGGSPSDMTGKRLSVYSKILRNNRDPLLDAFDFPDRFSSASSRNTTTTPVQSLFMINGSWTLDRAKALATKLKQENSRPSEQINAAWQRLFGRLPTSAEATAAQQFLATQSGAPAPKPAATFADLATGKALVFPNQPARRFEADDSPKTNSQTLLVETSFQLESLYPDATVRTLVSKWNSDNKQAGWAIGVTSTKSAYKPRNFIVQVVSDQGYEVVASNLRPELNQPYHAAVLLEYHADGKSQATFLLQKIGSQDPPQKAVVPMKSKQPPTTDFAIAIGGRTQSNRHFWHGKIGPVRLLSGRNKESELLVKGNQPNGSEAIIAEWSYASESLKSSAGKYALAVQPAANTLNSDPLVDLVHVLMNANEFLYVD